MTNEEIKKEFNRWIDLGRPNVWQWFPGVNRWETVSKFSWLNNTTYIIDDKYAEIRKAFYNDKTIQIYTSTCDNFQWEDWPSNEDLSDYIYAKQYDIRHYRIKPEKPMYEYQYIFKDENNLYKLSNSYYTTAYDAQEARQSDRWRVVDRFEPSKRLRK